MTSNKKRQRGESSSSQKKKPKTNQNEVSVQKYVSEVAKLRSEKVIAKKKVIKERGLLATTASVPEILDAYKWQQFVQQPGQINISIVREYYANAIEAQDGQVIVRGKKVKINREAINKYYGLTDIEDDEYTAWAEERNFPMVLKALTKPEAKWKTNQQQQPVRIEKKELRYEAKMWQHFVLARLMPGIHYSTLNVTRAILVSAIRRKLTMDVGKIIEEQMASTIKNPDLGLYYPAMITDFCKQLGVKDQKGDEICQPQRPITDSTILKMKQRIEQAVEHEEEQQQQQQEEAPPANLQIIQEKLIRIEEWFEGMISALERVEGIQARLETKIDEMAVNVQKMGEFMNFHHQKMEAHVEGLASTTTLDHEPPTHEEELPPRQESKQEPLTQQE